MDSVVTVDNGEFKWDSNTVAAKDVSFTAIPGDLVAVVGDTGSGKSSLLSSLCSEVEMTKGTGSVIGSVAYVEQSPWIMNGTLRDNILFGQEFDKEHYNKILYSCAFANDVKTWKYGDLTVIGERGINISGGQKARLALARALYARADIYILDDPLSAVDAHVKRHILDHVIMSSGMLKDRICIMSLNDRNILPYFNKVLTVDDCCVTFQDQIAKEYHSPIMVDPASTEFVYATDTGTINDNNKVSKEKESLKMNKYSILDNTRYIIKLCGIPILALLAMASLVHPIMSYIFDELKLDALNDNTNNIDIAGRNPALRYIYIEMARRFADNIRWKTMNTVKDPSRVRLENKLIYEFGSSLIHAPLSFYDSRIRQRISTDKDNIQQLHMGIDYYISENVNTTLSAILALYKICFNKPHILLVIPFLTVIQVMKNILIEPLETFLNEIETESNVEKEKISDTIADGKHLIRIFGVGRHFIGKYIANVDERQSIELPKSNLDDFQLLLYCFANEILSMLSKFCLLVISNYSGQRLTSGDFITYNQLTGTLISNIVILADISKDIQKVSTNVDLLREYTDVELEKMFVDGALQPEGVWPATGEIEFKDFSMKYRSDLEYSLKNINLTIHPGEKIGIVGRTGAGKSSLARVIFCLVNSRLCSGSILIDGCDISKMNLGYLRPKIGIIPQEPTLFSSTFKKNLDPLEEHTIEDMWAGIIKCGIAELIQPQKIARDADADADDQTWLDYLNKDTQKKIDEWNQDFKASSWTHKLFMLLFITKSKLRTEVLVHGTMPHGLDRYADMDYDFSGGQKQLFSLCRLLIRQHKVIVLDEATASVDLDTDQDMQKLIRSEFKESTVLTIAHRLETIMNSDRIIVMDKGEIVEVGPPDELLQNGGYFSELAKANDFGE